MGFKYTMGFKYMMGLSTGKSSDGIKEKVKLDQHLDPLYTHVSGYY